MAIDKKTGNYKCWPGCERLGPSYTAGGIVKWRGHFGKQGGTCSES